MLTALAAPALGPLAAPALATGSSASGGWGSEKSYLGRYHIDVLPGIGAPSPSATPVRASVFSAVVVACQQLSTAGTRPSGGELTMFMREVKKGKPLVPSGILNLRAPEGNELLYLTYLTDRNGVLGAKINGGAFVGPVLGSFTGHRTGPETIVATTTAEGIVTVEASFTRFSDSSEP
jgi:hypothetical protein